ncbi:transmembrane protein 74 [Elgaria multicarinata webbii]|uniref:transmembrane protein 74 n=1 Tax=Elgaria multicarinata webbii TaxID=159646 RepID=UPI002FCD5C68
MACMELLYLAKEGSQPDQCHKVDWSLQASPCQGQPDECKARTRAGAIAAECSEEHGKASQRAAQEDPAQVPLSFMAASGLSPEGTAAGEVASHPGPPLGEKEATRKRACCCESETSFTHVDENINNLDPTGSFAHKRCCQETDLRPHPDACGDRALEWPYDLPSLVSEEDDNAGSEAAGKSVDYGFISAILFLVSGILLVIVSYVVPRDVTVDPSTVAAREMERLEHESAKVGAHLDRCVIAGLCLLTLGGVVLSSLLMMSMWKGELYRRKRFAASKESAKLYGSFNFQVKSSPNDNMELSLVEEDALAIDG